MMDRFFKYTYRVRTSDLWQASMYYAYSSYMGIVNVVFIVSAIILAVSRWQVASDFMRAVMVVLVMMFVVIQPLVIWRGAAASLGGVFPELTLVFASDGMTVSKDGKRQHKSWNSIKGIVSKPTLVIVYVEDGNGYILRNSVLKETKKDLYDFLIEMKKRNS